MSYLILYCPILSYLSLTVSHPIVAYRFLCISSIYPINPIVHIFPTYLIVFWRIFLFPLTCLVYLPTLPVSPLLYLTTSTYLLLSSAPMCRYIYLSIDPSTCTNLYQHRLSYIIISLSYPALFCLILSCPIVSYVAVFQSTNLPAYLSVLSIRSILLFAYLIISVRLVYRIYNIYQVLLIYTTYLVFSYRMLSRVILILSCLSQAYPNPSLSDILPSLALSYHVLSSLILCTYQSTHLCILSIRYVLSFRSISSCVAYLL